MGVGTGSKFHGSTTGVDSVTMVVGVYHGSGRAFHDGHGRLHS